METGGCGLAGGDEQRIDSTGKEVVDLLALEIRLFLRRCKDQLIGASAQSGAKSLSELGEERMNEIRNNKSYGIALTGSETPSKHVGAIVEFLHPLQDARPGCITDIALVTEHARYRD